VNIQAEQTKLDGVLLIHSEFFEDERGRLYESYNKETFKTFGVSEEIIQEKHSFSKFKVLRGLHFQKEPYGQGKLVRCNFGKIFDVVVDIRRDSKTYGEWIGVELSEDNGIQLYIPSGLAHGFLVLSESGAMFNYHITKSQFNKDFDSGIRFDDEKIGIVWPIDINTMIISEKDKGLPSLNEYENR